MGRWVAEKLVLELASKRKPVVGTSVLVLGLSFLRKIVLTYVIQRLLI